MKLFSKTFLTLVSTTTLLTISSTSSAPAGICIGTPSPSEITMITGHAVKEEGLRIRVTNPDIYTRDVGIILNTSQKTTKILDAVTGFPVSFHEIMDGETVYAYVEPTSPPVFRIPLQVNALVLLCHVPTRYNSPTYLKVYSLEASGPDFILTDTNGIRYTTSENTLLPAYFVRNITSINNLLVGRTCLIWLEIDSSYISRIMILPKDETSYAAKCGPENYSWYFSNDGDGLFYHPLSDNDT